MIKPNKKEFDALRKEKKMSASEYTQYLLENGCCQVVAHTLGAQGAILTNQKESIRVTPPGIEVNSAVGAGDSFLGGLLFGLSQKKSLKDALKWGMASAGATLRTPGTELCQKEDVVQLLDEIKFE